MFRTVGLSIIRSLFTIHSAMVYDIQTAFEQGQDGTAVPSWPYSKAVYKHVWHIPLLSVQWINSWWRTDELSETCRISWQNKFMNWVHLVGFITKKSVSACCGTMWSRRLLYFRRLGTTCSLYLNREAEIPPDTYHRTSCHDVLQENLKAYLFQILY